MARKVFISFLGTNNYQKTRYQFGDCISEEVRFVQEALIGLQCRNWSESDSVIIFCTEGSREKNWVNDGQERAATEEEKEGLESRLSKLGLKAAVSEQDIREGFTENDMWEIFNTVYNSLEEEDEIYLDVTHAFRSIPLFTIPLFNFAKFMKGTKLAAIFYGAFEARNKETNITPIVELSSLVKLQATNVAASNFAEFGKVGSINIAINQFDSQNAIDAIKTIKKQLELLDYYILTCNMPKIREGKYYATINKCIHSVRVREAERQLLNNILESLAQFSAQPSNSNIISAAKWAIDHNMIQQAYTLGEEYMIYRIAGEILDEFNDVVERNYNANDDVVKAFVHAMLTLPPGKDFKLREVRGNINFKTISNLESYYDRDLRTNDKIKTASLYFENIRKTRNNLNHANGVGNSQSSVQMAMKELRDIFNKNLDNFNKLYPSK